MVAVDESVCRPMIAAQSSSRNHMCLSALMVKSMKKTKMVDPLLISALLFAES